jgi:MoaA/NifB/PqqE/SkfB family radical SAM enzyme
MANLVISEVCNLDCAYCFASEHMRQVKDGHSAAFISLEDFEARLDLLDQLGIQEARLIGGEPTLHPQFNELVKRARQRGKKIAVFSHGVLSERALDCLASLPVEACSVLVNMNAVGRKPKGERSRREAVVRKLGARVLMGFNIYQVDFNADDLLPLILETGARKAIRLGLAQTTLEGHNDCLHPKQYPLVAAKIVRLAQRSNSLGISLEFDCGFVRCMFTEAELEDLRQAKVKIGWHCGPVPDIDLHGEMLHCFPLANHIHTSIGCIIHLDELIDVLSAQASLYRMAGIYRECSICRYKHSGECSGGCLANTRIRFHESSRRVLLSGNSFAS